jgi:hypothetical protein
MADPSSAPGPGAAGYDSGEEFEREEMMRRAAAKAQGAPQPKLKLIRKPAGPPPVRVGAAPLAPFGDPRGFAAPAASASPPPPAAAAGPRRVAPVPVLSPAAPATAQPGPAPTAASRRTAPAPLMAAFPSTVFWGDKLGVLGAVYLVSEALVRSILMESEEFADRVAWVCLERLVAGAGAGEGGRGPAPSRAATLSDIRRQLGEIRATHSAFHSAVDHSIVHGAILVLLRACHLALLSAEMAASPYAWALDRHVQEIVFQCDFAAMVLAKVEMPDPSAAPPHLAPLVEERPDAPQLFLPAHYANEALLRALPLLDLGALGDAQKKTPATCATLARLVGEHAQSVSNDWLRRNLTRLAAGLRIAATVGNAMEQESAAEAGAAAEEGPSRGAAPSPSLFLEAAVENIMRERAQAINAWTQRQGSEMGNMFTDPLYRIEAELARGGAEGC